MREVQAADAQAELPRLLDEVERGAIVVIMRGGHPIARLTPEPARREAEIGAAIDGIKALRRGKPPISPGEIRELVDAGRKR